MHTLKHTGILAHNRINRNTNANRHKLVDKYKCKPFARMNKIGTHIRTHTDARVNRKDGAKQSKKKKPS
jgi:transcriptional regulator of met regulon